MRPTSTTAAIRRLHMRGYRVKVEHYRPIHGTDVLSPVNSGENRTWVAAKGGVSKVLILDDGETVVAEAVAECSGLDNFRPKLGTAIALGRAIKELAAKVPALKGVTV